MLVPISCRVRGVLFYLPTNSSKLSKNKLKHLFSPMVYSVNNMMKAEIQESVSKSPLAQ